MIKRHPEDEIKIMDLKVRGISVKVSVIWDEFREKRLQENRLRKLGIKFMEDIGNDDTVSDDSEGDS